VHALLSQTLSTAYAFSRAQIEATTAPTKELEFLTKQQVLPFGMVAATLELVCAMHPEGSSHSQSRASYARPAIGRRLWLALALPPSGSVF